MSWISEIAGKAEQLLTKIDNNAASILKKEAKLQSASKETVLNEVTTEVVTESSKDNKAKYSPPVGNKTAPMKMTRSSHSSPSINNRQGDEHLIDFLNNSAAIEIDQLQMTSKEPVTNGHSEKSIEELNDDVLELAKENQMLKNEVRTLNGELTLLLNRTKSAEKGASSSEERLTKAESEVNRLGKELKVVGDKLLKAESYSHKLYAENQRLIEKHKVPEQNSMKPDAETLLAECKLQAQHKEEALQSNILSLQSRLEESERNLTQLQKETGTELSETSARLSEARTELEQYRARAQKTLSEKDKLIAELRKVGSDQEVDDIVTLELDQLRNERSIFMEECEELRYKLETSRAQLVEGERHLESLKEETGSSLRAVQTKLAEETARRLAAEEHCNAHAEELHAVREELSRQVAHLTQRVRERDAELSRLRTQLSRQRPVSPPPPAHIEERISSLTSALVRKQTALEQVAKERNELRFELDQTKNKFRDYISQVQGRMINVNDTDDAKLQVPSLFLESPFDTGVTRRVKRAYSSLDAVSIRTGVFLRRYPLARIIVLCYVICLQLWVCIILFTNTPETKL